MDFFFPWFNLDVATRLTYFVGGVEKGASSLGGSRGF